MSYHVSIYNKSIVSFLKRGLDLDGFEHPKIPKEKLDSFKKALLSYKYILVSDNESHAEYKHENSDLNLYVNIYETEITFSIPYFTDMTDDAIFLINMTPFELTDESYVINNPQEGTWESLGEPIDISVIEESHPVANNKKWWQFW